jgi:adenylate kinase
VQDLILLGPPGAGKGTQAAVLTREGGLQHVSTGDILRAAVQAGTELGRSAKQYMDRGELVPDDVIIGIVGERLQDGDCAHGVLFDGFPRTLAQAEALSELMGGLGRPEPAVLAIDVPSEEIIRRLAGRRVCRTCGGTYNVESLPEGTTECPKADCEGELYQRDDDTPEAVAQRLTVYEEQTQPLLTFYGGRGSLTMVPGTGSPDQVAQRAVAALSGRGA